MADLDMNKYVLIHNIALLKEFGFESRKVQPNSDYRDRERLVFVKGEGILEIDKREIYDLKTVQKLMIEFEYDRGYREGLYKGIKEGIDVTKQPKQ